MGILVLVLFKLVILGNLFPFYGIIHFIQHVLVLFRS
jgi:hypothetical protein